MQEAAVLLCQIAGRTAGPGNRFWGGLEGVVVEVVCISMVRSSVCSCNYNILKKVGVFWPF